MKPKPEGATVKKRPKQMSNSAAAHFLDGGGEMGERIRGFNWSSTPIGPIESWPLALRSMVSILLANRFPLLLWWGPDYIQLYNDPYRPVPGTKHPAEALGRPARECWSEIWQILEPLIDTPFQGGPATWMEDMALEVNRHGFVEETHFTIAYSPVPDTSVPGGIGGVLATVHEITEKIIGERRVGALRNIFARVSEAKSAEDACHLAAKALATHNKDIPFALIYLIDAEGKGTRLAGASGIGMGKAISPLTADLSEENAAGWPLAEVRQSETAQLVESLAERFDSVPPGPWSDPPDTALVLPIRSNKAHHPSGLLVAGISVRLKFDEVYRSFLEMLTAQVATAIANARALEQEKQRAEALAELDRAKTAFFSNISHELRTPLTLMLGPIEEELRDNPAARPRLELAQRSSLRLLKLVNMLLDFSRIETGRIQASYEPADLARFTADLASEFRAATQKAGLRLAVDCPPLPERVYVDREMWEKIVLNLMGNAFKFTFEGEIKVALRWHGERVELSVSDTGVGIPDSELPRIFERFHRVRGARSRTHEGTGIGLALVQELAGLHGGEVKVESCEGIGTTFTVSIQTGTAHLPPERIAAARQLESTGFGATPFVDEALRSLPEVDTADSLTGTEAAPLRDPAAEPQTPSQQLPRILYADDNADMREYVRRLLAQHYQVEAVSDGQAALERVQADPPDLVLTDVMMPRLDGFELLRQLRANDRTRTIPVIVLSARAGEEARVEGLGAGANDYLIKPFSARELLARLRSQLEMSRLRREGEERVTRVLESIADGFHVLDAHWRFTFINAAARRMLAAQGVDAEKLIGKHFWNEAFPDVRGTILERELKRAMTERVPVELEPFYELWQRCYGVRAYPVEDGGLSIYFQDTTERKQAEDSARENEKRFRDTNAELAQRLTELQNATLEIQTARRAALNVMEDAVQSRQAMETLNGKLRESEERFAQFMRCLPGLAWIKDPRGRYVYVNDAAEKVFGTRRADVYGKTDQELFPPETAAQFTRNDQRALASESGIQTIETLAHADSSVHHSIVSKFPVPGPDGKEIMVGGVAFDVTERKQAEESLQEAGRRKDEFLAMLAHELRNPLAPIRNALGILQLAKGNQEAIQSASAMMERQISQMVRLVDDLLDVSRISRGKVELRPGFIDLASGVNHAVEATRPLCESRGLTLTVKLPPQPVYLNADPVRLAQVVGNLLSNACKFTDKGGCIWLTAEVVASGEWRVASEKKKGEHRDGTAQLLETQGWSSGTEALKLDTRHSPLTTFHAVIRVRDNGIGIAADQLPRIFELFTQVDTSLERRQSGLGIGLTLAKNLVELHGGSLEVHSAGLGQGSEFVVRLPMIDESRVPSAERKEVGNDALAAKRRILVVDDNMDSAESLAMLLTLAGNETHAAFDGLEAVEAAATFRPDVILLDIGLPELNGYDVARQIREQPWGQKMVLVALTGWGQEDDRRRAQEAGFNHHFTKPVDPAALKKLLAEMTHAGAAILTTEGA